MAPPRPPAPLRRPVLRALLAGALSALGRAVPQASAAALPPAVPAAPVAAAAAAPPAAGVATGPAGQSPTGDPLGQQAPGKRKNSGNAQSSEGVIEYLCSQQEDIADSVKSPVGVYLHHLDKGFHDYPHQSAVAAIALVMGCLCIWNGPRTWQALFTAAMVAAATSLARIEAEAWSFDMVSEVLLMFQAAFATGVAIQSGFEGFQVLFGTAVGFLICYGCGGWARSFNGFAPGFAVFWYSAGAMFGALTLTVWQQPVLVTLAPLLGGFLVATSVEFLGARLYMACTDEEPPMVLPPRDMPWIDIATELLFLLGPGAMAAHGGCALLATLVYRSGAGDEQRLPAVICLIICVAISLVVAGVQESVWMAGLCLMWGLITAVSSYYQLGLLQNWKAKTLAEVAETWSNAGSQIWRTGSFYEPIFQPRDLEGGRGLGFAR